MQLLRVASNANIRPVAIDRRVAVNLAAVMTVATATAALTIILSGLSHLDKLSNC